MAYPTISWKQETLTTDLQSMADYAIQLAERNRSYYSRNSSYKRVWAKGLRLIAIFATAIAGLLPIFSQIGSKHEIVIDPAWATVAISVAITAIGLDRFFGFSSAWMRFVITEIKIQNKIEQFKLNIENERFSWAGVAPDFDKGKSSLNIVVNFINEITEIVKDETNTWMLEFQTALQKLNEDVNVKDKSQALGGLAVSIENGEKFTGGLIIRLEGQPTVHVVGSTYAFNNLYPKIYTLSVDGMVIEEKEGKKTEKKAHAEVLVNVTTGTITNVTVVLKGV